VDDCEFSDSEVAQIALVAREEFEQEAEWKVSTVFRPSGRRNVVEIHIENDRDHRCLIIPVTCQEFSEENPANGSQLTDTVFNISIRLMEFNGIRGFDEFEDGATVSLEIYPADRPELPPLPPGFERKLLSPFYHPELRSLSEPDEQQDT
jgi:hypothetical protein